MAVSPRRQGVSQPRRPRIMRGRPRNLKGTQLVVLDSRSYAPFRIAEGWIAGQGIVAEMREVMG